MTDPRQEQLQGERRRVTVLFADISGFTAMAERMDPEHVRNLVNSCFQDLVPIVTGHGGTVDKFTGDGIMALFGAPTAHENDPERALLTALAMREQLERFNTARGTALAMHFGINTGLVIAGGIGASGRLDYSVIGDAVNLASRLADHASPGEILVGPETLRLTSHGFEFEPGRQVRVKGKAEPVPVARVLRRGRHEEPARPGGPRGRIGSPLIGRAVQVDRLIACAEQALRGTGSIVAILGGAGLGKSRLVAEVRRRMTNRGLVGLEGRALSIGQTLAYWPILDMIRSYAGITESDSEAEAAAKLEGRLAGLLDDEHREIVPSLARLLGLEVRDDELRRRLQHITADAMRGQIMLAVRRFFERLAGDHPLVLFFEDLHWADESSTDLIEHLMPLVEAMPLILCLISRPDATAPAARLLDVARTRYGDRYTEIALAPLGPADSATLLGNLLGTPHVVSGLREAILSRTEGNPFFVEEVVRALIDLGGLVPDETGAWRATPKAESIAIPETVQGVISARIDRLEDDVKQVLKLSAVIGRSFLYRVLCGIAEADREIDRQLGMLQRVELIREKRREPDLEFIFHHALAHEATYESILLERRRQLHRQVAECIESLFAERLEEFHGLLAHHYARAEAWDKAREYLLRVGDQAGRVAANAEALAHYRQAMVAHERAFGHRWDPLERATLERKLGEALFRRGEHEQAVEYLRRAREYLGTSPIPTTRLGIRLAIAREAIVQAGHRIFLPLFRRSSDARDSIAEELYRVHLASSLIDYFLDHREPFVLNTLRILNLGERHGMPVATVIGLMGTGLICDLAALARLGERYHRRAVRLAAQIAEPIATGYAYLGEGLHEYAVAANWSAAMESFRRSARANWEAGELRLWGMAVSSQAFILYYRGDFRDQAELAGELIRVGEDAGDRLILAWGLGHLAHARLAQGADLAEVIAQFDRSNSFAKAVPDYPSISLSTAVLGSCFLRQDRIREARDAFEESRRIIGGLGLRMFFVVPAVVQLAHGAIALVDRVDPTERGEALERARQACRAALRQTRFTQEGMPATYRWQGTLEWMTENTRAARRWWRRSLGAAERLGARYELAQTHLEIGCRAGDRAHVERAERLFAEIGARYELAEAREWLLRSGARS